MDGMKTEKSFLFAVSTPELDASEDDVRSRDRLSSTKQIHYTLFTNNTKSKMFEYLIGLFNILSRTI